MTPLLLKLAGLPPSAWLLILAAAGGGLGLELAFLRGQRRRRQRADRGRRAG